jgi:hypothetical protein
MVSLMLQNGKVHFQVEPSALERAHIQYDASFFAMASGETNGSAK